MQLFCWHIDISVRRSHCHGNVRRYDDSKPQRSIPIASRLTLNPKDIRCGRKGIDGLAERGSSVVDYYIVGEENMGLIGNFKVTTMNESIEEMKLEGVAVRVPDHSLLQ